MANEGGEEVPVLIVGAGPAGLSAAVTLARAGVESLLVERRRERSGLPRATGVSLRTMELLRSWGLEDEIRAGGVELTWQLRVCDTLAAVAAGETFELGWPTAEQSAVLSPTRPACVPQDHLEPVLLTHLRSLGAARVELGTEVVAVESRPDGVRAVLRRAGQPGERVVRARYLLAADGAHSTVRSALGIPMPGEDQLLDARTVLFRAPLWDVLGEHRCGLYAITRPGIGGTFLPAGSGDRWMYSTERDPAREGPADFTDARLRARIQLAAGIGDLDPQIERTGTFTFAWALAERFRQYSAFLIGDAAHRVTPRGGSGMNSAIHDGHDLGWKLAWVLHGWARPGLLDTYEPERRPIVEHNLARSIDIDGSRRVAVEELPADLGGRLPHAWIPGTERRRSTLDLLGPGLTLFSGPDAADTADTAGSARWEGAARSVVEPVPLAVRRLDALTARAVGVPAGGALLVRPDAQAAGWLAPGTDAVRSLRAAITAAVGGRPRADFTGPAADRDLAATG